MHTSLQKDALLKYDTKDQKQKPESWTCFFVEALSTAEITQKPRRWQMQTQMQRHGFLYS